ncbi:MAG: regulatory protein RecX [Candidatus Gracilibacteria bacterium]
MEDPVYRNLMNYAMRALSRRAHTSFELREKLGKRPYCTPQLEDQVLARLQELGLINDENYVRHAIEEAVRYKLQGRYKLASRLQRKGISFEETNTLWAEAGISEQELAREALKRAHKRFASVPPEKLYQRRAQFLASRGFSPEIIFELAKVSQKP